MAHTADSAKKPRKSHVLLVSNLQRSWYECSFCHERRWISPLWRATDLQREGRRFAVAHATCNGWHRIRFGTLARRIGDVGDWTWDTQAERTRPQLYLRSPSGRLFRFKMTAAGCYVKRLNLP